MTFIAIVALGILVCLSIFQALLVAGAPLGRFAWGGSHAILPVKLRISSLLAIVIYLIMAMFLVSKAGIVPAIVNTTILQIGLWVFTVYLGLGIAMNAMSRSKLEKIVMVPVSAVLAACFLVVALG